MKSLADFLSEGKSASISSSSIDNQSIQSRRSDTQGTLRREGINPILSGAKSRPQTENSKPLAVSPYLDKRRWINLGEGWHQITQQGSGAVTRCGLYSVVESSNATKCFACLYIPRSDAAYSACMCDKPEYDLQIQFKIHFKQNTTILPQFDLLLAYKNGDNHLILRCDALSKYWALIYQNSGREFLVSQIPDPNIRCNVFYSLLVQIRINCISIDMNGVPIITKVKVPNLSDLSGLMGLRAQNAKFSVKGWKLKGLNVSKYKSCIPSMEEVSQQDDAEETNYSSMSLPQPPNTSGKSISSASATNQINPPAAIPRKPSSNEIPELTTLSIDSKPSQYLMADGTALQQQQPQNAVNPPPFPSSSSSKAFSGLSPDLIEQLFASADKTIAESILQDIVQQDLNIQFDDIASLNDAKRILYEAIILPSMMPEFFTGIREPWKGILLYGPPGTGKTMLAKAVCSLKQSTFFNCSAATLISKYRGDSEKIIRCLFQAAKIFAPSVIFIDEIDALVSSRSHDNEHEASRRLKTELFCQLDGLGSNRGQHQIVFLAATNCPWDLDPAMRRRLEKRIFVPLPDYEARIDLIRLLIRNIVLSDDFEIETLAHMTEGYSGSDLQIALREASMMPMRRLLDLFSPQQIVEMRNRGEINMPRVIMKDFITALQNTRPSVASGSLQKFKDWETEFGNK